MQANRESKRKTRDKEVTSFSESEAGSRAIPSDTERSRSVFYRSWVGRVRW